MFSRDEYLWTESVPAWMRMVGWRMHLSYTDDDPKHCSQCKEYTMLPASIKLCRSCWHQPLWWKWRRRRLRRRRSSHCSQIGNSHDPIWAAPMASVDQQFILQSSPSWSLRPVSSLRFSQSNSNQWSSAHRTHTSLNLWAVHTPHMIIMRLCDFPVSRVGREAAVSYQEVKKTMAKIGFLHLFLCDELSLLSQPKKTRFKPCFQTFSTLISQQNKGWWWWWWWCTSNQQVEKDT